jgi:hypothetical protein
MYAIIAPSATILAIRLPIATPAMPRRGRPKAPVSRIGDSSRLRPIHSSVKRNGVFASPVLRSMISITTKVNRLGMVRQVRRM